MRRPRESCQKAQKYQRRFILRKVVAVCKWWQVRLSNCENRAYFEAYARRIRTDVSSNVARPGTADLPLRAHTGMAGGTGSRTDSRSTKNGFQFWPVRERSLPGSMLWSSGALVHRIAPRVSAATQRGCSSPTGGSAVTGPDQAAPACLPVRASIGIVAGEVPTGLVLPATLSVLSGSAIAGHTGVAGDMRLPTNVNLLKQTDLTPKHFTTGSRSGERSPYGVGSGLPDSQSGGW